MGYTTEHRGRRPKVFVSETGQFLNSTWLLYIVLSSHKEFVDNVVIQ